MIPILPSQIPRWLSQLVQIPSVSPSVAGPTDGAPGEEALAKQIAMWFTALGGQVIVDEVEPHRPNVYGMWRGRSDRWVAVDVHMDTVSAAQMPADQFSGRVDGTRVYGRGAVDTKASLSVILTLLEEMKQSGIEPGPNLLIGATVDEEIGATGAPAFARWIEKQPYSVEQIVVAEPTLCIPVYGHKGVVRLEFEITGKSAHSSQPKMGQNAVVAGAQLVLALVQEDERLQQLNPSSELGNPTLTVSVIHGGTGINVVPASCQISIDRRVVDHERAKDVANQLIEFAQANSPLPLVAHTQKELDAFYQSPQIPWVQQLAQWSGSQEQVVPYGTNAWAYQGVVDQRIVIGPGSIDQAHGKEEWVEVSQLERMAEIYARWWELA
ncbi:MAG: M20/M25/M40 family metallo-hydrolase [Chloroflexota bacterium]